MKLQYNLFIVNLMMYPEINFEGENQLQVQKLFKKKKNRHHLCAKFQSGTKLLFV